MSEPLAQAAAADAAAHVEAAANEVRQDEAISDATDAAVSAQVAASDAQTDADVAADVAAVAADVGASAAAEASTAADTAQAAAAQTDEVAYATAQGLAELQARVDDLHAWRESQTKPPEPPKDDVATIPVTNSQTGSEPTSDSDNKRSRRHRFGR